MEARPTASDLYEATTTNNVLDTPPRSTIETTQAWPTELSRPAQLTTMENGVEDQALEDLNTEDDLCNCTCCAGGFPAQIIKRGEDEYIVLNGRILTYHGAPVGGNESAFHYLHEDIVRPFEDGIFCEDHCRNTTAPTPVHPRDLDVSFKDYLWPAKASAADVFTPDELVDMYRAIRPTRSS